MKKFLAILLAAMMLLATAGVAFASGDTETTTSTYKITVNNDNENISIDGRTYNAYQLFSATVVDGVVSYVTGDVNVEYDHDGNTETAALTGNALLEYLADLNDNSAEIRAFADYVYNTYILNKEVTPAKSAVAADEAAVIELTEAGYYLVFGDGAAADGGAAVASLVMLKPAVAENVTINPKFDAPNLDKEIWHNENETWGDVGDNQIGDKVYYRIKTSIPEKTENFDVYDYIIHDTMTAGLTFNNDVKIYLDEDQKDELAKTYYDVVATTTPRGFTVDVDVKTAVADKILTPGGYIWTYYSCTLNEDALIWDEGSNDNTAQLEYSNNPYVDSTGKTNEVTVYDYTFSYEVKKVDTAKAPLAGAQFVLSTNDKLGILKIDETGNVVTADEAETPVTDLIAFNLVENVYVVDNDKDANAKVVLGTGTETSFEIDGLDDAVEYYLYEVTAPDGYNKLTAPVKVVISADYDLGTGENAGKQVLKEGYPKCNNSGDMYVEVLNNFGATLPSTGGIGTTLFYMFGGIMAAGSALMLVVRRRADAEEE